MLQNYRVFLHQLKSDLAPRRLSTILGLLCFVSLWVLPMHANVVVYIYQSGSNIVSSYSGTIDLTGLTAGGNDGPTPAYIWAAQATEVFGPTVAGQPVYSGITGPADFGDGAAKQASSSTGDTFGYGGLDEDLLLPSGYVMFHSSPGRIRGTIQPSPV